jgi:hypothetical protein
MTESPIWPRAAAEIVEVGISDHSQRPQPEGYRHRPDASERPEHGAKLYNAEVHLVARTDVTSIKQLHGQKVNNDQVGSGTNYSMCDIFKNLNLKVEDVSLPQAEAIERTKHRATDRPRSATALRVRTGTRAWPVPAKLWCYDVFACRPRCGLASDARVANHRPTTNRR